jgi:hypothetical protein
MRCAPQSADISAGGTPQTVGLEEVLVQPPAVVLRDVALEGRLVLRRPHPDPEERQHAAKRLDRSEVREGVHDLDRVVVELALVVDAAGPGPEHEVLVREDLVPERLHLRDLREEPVAADVEAVPVGDDGAADAAHHVVRFQHGGGGAALAELVGGGEAGGAGADDDDLSRRGGGRKRL